MLINCSDKLSQFAKYFAKKHNLTIVQSPINRFSDGELFITLPDITYPQSIYLLINSLDDISDNLFKLCLLSHSLKLHHQPKEIIAIMPYFPYARQDKQQYNFSLASDYVLDMLSASGVTKIITWDIHSNILLENSKIEIQNIIPYVVFAEYTKKQMHLKDTVIVAPDQGASTRALLLAKELGVDLMLAKKTRNVLSVSVNIPEFIEAAHYIIFDDIIVSGSTILKTAESIISKKPNCKIFIYATHALFTRETSQIFNHLNIVQILALFASNYSINNFNDLKFIDLT